MRLLISIIVLCALASIAYASPQTSLLVEVSFLPNGSAHIDDVHVSFAGIDEQLSRPQQDRLELIIDGTTYFSTFIPVTFLQMDSLPLPQLTVAHHLPYYGNKGILRVARKNLTLAEFDLTQLCNNNGRCQEFENGISCPVDCDVRFADNVCQPYSDTACDPDCAKGLDADCGRPLPKATNFSTPIILIAGLVIAILVIYITTRKNRK